MSLDANYNENSRLVRGPFCIIKRDMFFLGSAATCYIYFGILFYNIFLNPFHSSFTSSLVLCTKSKCFHDVNTGAKQGIPLSKYNARE